MSEGNDTSQDGMISADASQSGQEAQQRIDTQEDRALSDRMTESSSDQASNNTSENPSSDVAPSSRRETPTERAQRYGISSATALGIYDSSTDEKKTAKPKTPLSPKSLAFRAALIVVLVIAVAVIVVPALAGVLNVNVIASDESMQDARVSVAIYKGDVTAELLDDASSNDPEPMMVKTVSIGQRAVFDMADFGGYTVVATLEDAPEGWVDPEPIVVSMMGFDQRITIDINE